MQNRVFGVFGEQRNRGLELSVFGNPVRGLRVLGGLTLIDAEQRVTAGGINQGKDAIGVPEKNRMWPNPNDRTVWDALPRGLKFTPPDVLFKKIEDEQVAELAVRFGGGGA